MLVVGSRNYSSWSLRPWLLLRHLGLEFTERQFELDTPEFEAEIATLSPTRRVPVLLHGAVRVWESLAICEYVSELADGRGWPRDPAHARHGARDRGRDALRLRRAARRLPDERPRVRPARADDAVARARPAAHRRDLVRLPPRPRRARAPTSSAGSASPTRCSRRSCCACAATGCRSRSSRDATRRRCLSDAHLVDWIEASRRETRVIPHEEVGAGA